MLTSYFLDAPVEVLDAHSVDEVHRAMSSTEPLACRKVDARLKAACTLQVWKVPPDCTLCREAAGD